MNIIPKHTRLNLSGLCIFGMMHIGIYKAYVYINGFVFYRFKSLLFTVAHRKLVAGRDP